MWACPTGHTTGQQLNFRFEKYNALLKHNFLIEAPAQQCIKYALNTAI
jgi:hypothetical protein